MICKCIKPSHGVSQIYAMLYINNIPIKKKHNSRVYNINDLCLFAHSSKTDKFFFFILRSESRIPVESEKFSHRDMEMGRKTFYHNNVCNFFRVPQMPRNW